MVRRASQEGCKYNTENDVTVTYPVLLAPPEKAGHHAQTRGSHGLKGVPCQSFFPFH